MHKSHKFILQSVFPGQVSSPTARRGRPPLARPPRGGYPTAEPKKEKVPPVSSGSRKEMLSKDKLKERSQKKPRLPKFSKLVRRVRTFIGGRSKPEYQVDIESARGCKSERLLARPDQVLETTTEVQEAHSERLLRLPLEAENPEPPVQVDTPLSRQMSIESIPVPDTARVSFQSIDSPYTCAKATLGEYCIHPVHKKVPDSGLASEVRMCYLHELCFRFLQQYYIILSSVYDTCDGLKIPWILCIILCVLLREWKLYFTMALGIQMSFKMPSGASLPQSVFL